MEIEGKEMEAPKKGMPYRRQQEAKMVKNLATKDTCKDRRVMGRSRIAIARMLRQRHSRAKAGLNKAQ